MRGNQSCFRQSYVFPPKDFFSLINRRQEIRRAEGSLSALGSAIFFHPYEVEPNKWFKSGSASR